MARFQKQMRSLTGRAQVIAPPVRGRMKWQTALNSWRTPAASAASAAPALRLPERPVSTLTVFTKPSLLPNDSIASGRQETDRSSFSRETRKAAKKPKMLRLHLPYPTDVLRAPSRQARSDLYRENGEKKGKQPAVTPKEKISGHPAPCDLYVHCERIGNLWAALSHIPQAEMHFGNVKTCEALLCQSSGRVVGNQPESGTEMWNHTWKAWTSFLCGSKLNKELLRC